MSAGRQKRSDLARGGMDDLFARPKPAAVFYRVAENEPHRIIYGGPEWGRWSAIQEQVAGQIGCDPEQVAVKEAYWGDDGYAELVMCADEIVGTFDRPISKKDLTAIRATFASRPAPPRAPKAKIKKAGAKRPKPRVPGQRELLLPISGGREDAAQSAPANEIKRKAG